MGPASSSLPLDLYRVEKTSCDSAYLVKGKRGSRKREREMGMEERRGRWKQLSEKGMEEVAFPSEAVMHAGSRAPNHL